MYNFSRPMLQYTDQHHRKSIRMPFRAKRVRGFMNTCSLIVRPPAEFYDKGATSFAMEIVHVAIFRLCEGTCYRVKKVQRLQMFLSNESQCGYYEIREMLLRYRCLPPLFATPFSPPYGATHPLELTKKLRGNEGLCNHFSKGRTDFR